MLLRNIPQKRRRRGRGASLASGDAVSEKALAERKDQALLIPSEDGAVAERLGRRLQSVSRGFDSPPHLHQTSKGGE